MIAHHKLAKLILISSIFFTLLSSAYTAPILVVGHKNPDSDSIFAAISLAYLKSQQGTSALAIAQGKPNPESQFVLDYFGLQAPAVMTNVAGNRVVLVDHNSYSQAPDDLRHAEIEGIVDHHSLGGISTDEPVDILIQAVGSTNSIIWELYQRANITIPPAIAGGMLSAILSDTLIFKSPTTTELDRIAVQSLATMAHVKDIQKYGQQMFLAGEMDLKTAPIGNLLQRDFKNFDMSGYKVGVAQLTAVSFELLIQRKSSFLVEMQTLQKEQNYQSIILLLTDIQSAGSEMLVVGENQQEVENAFNLSMTNHAAWAAGVVSRKKQVIPVLEKVFKKIALGQSNPPLTNNK